VRSYGGRAGKGVPQALVGNRRGVCCPNTGPLAVPPAGPAPVIALTVPAPPPFFWSLPPFRANTKAALVKPPL